MFVSSRWDGNLFYRKVLHCGTGGRVHSLLLNALVQNNSCHMENHGGPTQSVMVTTFPAPPVCYQLPHYMLLPPRVSGLMKAGMC